MDKKPFDAAKEKSPMAYKIYKGVHGKLGAMRFTLKRAYTNKIDKKQEGCIFFDIAPAVGNNVYDWDQKITFSFNLTDIGKILLYIRNPNHPSFKQKDGSQKCSIYHDKNAGTTYTGTDVKILDIIKSDKTTNFIFNSTHTYKETYKKASVTLSPDEAIILASLLDTAIPAILSWP